MNEPSGVQPLPILADQPAEELLRAAESAFSIAIPRQFPIALSTADDLLVLVMDVLRHQPGREATGARELWWDVRNIVADFLGEPTWRITRCTLLAGARAEA